VRVSTVLAFDGPGNLRGFYLEMPCSVRAEMEALIIGRRERSSVLTQYRWGFRNGASKGNPLTFWGPLPTRCRSSIISEIIAFPRFFEEVISGGEGSWPVSAAVSTMGTGVRNCSIWPLICFVVWRRCHLGWSGPGSPPCWG
jgi:hypothetical protein